MWGLKMEGFLEKCEKAQHFGDFISRPWVHEIGTKCRNLLPEIQMAKTVELHRVEYYDNLFVNLMVTDETILITTNHVCRTRSKNQMHSNHLLGISKATTTA